MSFFQFVRSHLGLSLSLVFLALLFSTALVADLLASDKPLLARVEGQLFILPALFDPPELQAYDNQSLLNLSNKEDWSLSPPVQWGPNQPDKTSMPLEGPSPRHFLGTDSSRRDVLSRLIHGSRSNLKISFVAVGLYIFIGTLLGILAGYFGGWADFIVSRLTETLLSVPVFFLILAVLGLVENPTTMTLALTIGLVYWTGVARLTRAEVLSLRESDFILAARAMGLSPLRILYRHILPLTLGPVIVVAAFGLASTTLLEAALSFLGVGAPDSTASWGGLLRNAMGNLQAWWLVVFPGLVLFMTVVAWNVMGDVLRDYLDPRSRRDS
ncbi:ABC transporter permease [Myxococcota bacterium]|nr:ABC transporter permease [Myxococcota bacterium]